MCTPCFNPKNAGGDKYPFPSYADLDKECRDLFQKGYNIGQYVANVKNRTCHGMEINTSASHKQEDKSAKADVSVKTDLSTIMPGLGSTHKWDTDNVLKNEIYIQDTLYPGLKLGTEVKFDAEKVSVGGGVKVQQKHQYFTLDGTVLGSDDPNVVVGGTLVTGHKGLMAGYKVEYDVNAGELKGNSLGFAYRTKEYSFFLTRNNNTAAIEGCFHHKVSREVEIGAQGKVGAVEGGGSEGGEANNTPQLSIAGKYMFNGYGHVLRAKVDNRSILSLGLELKILPGWQSFAGTEVDLKKFSEGNHKIGFGMDFGLD